MNVTLNMEQKIKLLFEKYLSNTATAEERKELNDWIAKDESLGDWFENKLENSSSQMDEMKQSAILQKINDQIGEATETKRRFSLPSWTRYAAAIALIAIAVSGIFTLMNSTQKSAQFVEVAAEHGQKAVLTLPDGTKVLLNSDSKIKYSTAYNQKHRNVELLGEAFFDVEKNEKLAFVVHAGDLDIKAVGTAFNVKAYPNEELISTTLTEGKLLLTSGKEEISLLPNERVEFRKDEMTMNKINLQSAENSIGWMNDKLSYENASLEDVVADFIRIYNIDIQFASESIKQQRFTGQIENNGLEAVLKVISLSSPIRVEYSDSLVRLYDVPSENKLFKP